MGPQYVNLCGYHERDDVNVPMCHAQARVLQSCPEFVNDWCYQVRAGQMVNARLWSKAPRPRHSLLAKSDAQS